MKKIFASIFFLIFILTNGQSQADSVSNWEKKPVMNLSGFVDVFYVYDFNRPTTTHRQPFLYNHNRHNEFNLNLGMVKLSVEHPKYRTNLAFHAGTYSNDNYANEPGLLKNIFEANVGISLNKKNNLWVDAGVMPSHIGFESAISMDNWNLTRSLLAENSPYFLSGAKLTYLPNNKWEFAGLIVNGWQRIQRLSGNSMMSLGTKINFKPSDQIQLNWSTFIGTDDPDSTRRMRYFSNFYGQFQFSEKFGLIAGFDLGFQQRSKNSTTYDPWYSPVLIAQLKINQTWKTALRAEYYQDQTGIIIPTPASIGFKTSGLSLNIGYSPSQTLVWRLEGRWLNSINPIFESNSELINNNFFIGTSFAIKFSEPIKHQ